MANTPYKPRSAFSYISRSSGPTDVTVWCYLFKKIDALKYFIDLWTFTFNIHRELKVSKALNNYKSSVI